jgi:hypothetical protein
VRDKPCAIFYKLLSLIIPFFLIEFWAEKKTGLIRWKKGWNWYHTLIGIMFKSLATRLFIGIVRKISKNQV